MKVELEYEKTNGKNPLHLLLDVEIPFSEKVKEQVDRLWEQSLEDPEKRHLFDADRCVVVDKQEINGREIFVLAKVKYRYIYVWENYVLKTKESAIQGLGPFEHANPIGKLYLPLEMDKGNSGLGVMDITNRYTALGGFIDITDCTQTKLPSGDHALVPFKPNVPLESSQFFQLAGTLKKIDLWKAIDRKKLSHMVRKLDECEQNGLPMMTPAQASVIREGGEEAGISCKTYMPIGKVNLIEVAFGRKIRQYESWYVYRLVPEKEKTSDEVIEAFRRFRNSKSNEEKELKELDIFPDELTELIVRMKREPSRMSAQAVLLTMIKNLENSSIHQISSNFTQSRSTDPDLTAAVEQALKKMKQHKPKSLNFGLDGKERI
ncbi:hypothetical protein SAMN05444392_102363 [Seinonella peptonophila]|uniref:Uncharacterized protein n=1 Tax=Seinonella peptonophila TaxID=112248 RepID=A0A1M4VH96_9BACL|nr:hypothetical protein [Seinonella peptonophila]SHE68318.1 hypothetical protein SAMN05444392_102363 [Seinonella peptonophila]